MDTQTDLEANSETFHRDLRDLALLLLAVAYGGLVCLFALGYILWLFNQPTWAARIWGPPTQAIRTISTWPALILLGAPPLLLLFFHPLESFLLRLQKMPGFEARSEGTREEPKRNPSARLRPQPTTPLDQPGGTGGEALP